MVSRCRPHGLRAGEIGRVEDWLFNRVESSVNNLPPMKFRVHSVPSPEQLFVPLV